ncbi:MAG: hypothetical protein LAT75_12030 [Candidatus Cyclonatronum sp.]|uniref:hypothetical protein n=1 Tax=Cyclonatronum sp. TaxID=3024185 RepID=UPI0025BA2619|nr:hypothetical protein [Cyclonatronum sp.]MCH8487587.1 hypothetical protein [Cyclonatronum sp.]
MEKNKSLHGNKMQWLTGNLWLIVTVLMLLVIIDIAIRESSLLNSVSLQDLQSAHVLGIVTGLFVIAIFVERVIEVFLIYAREPAKLHLNNSLEQATDPNEKTGLKQKLTAYKQQTRQMAVGMGLLIGILISAAGFRTLSDLAGAEGLMGLSDLQQRIFTVTDILLTGVIISGGSAAIDKIAGKFSDYFDLNRNLKEPADEKKPNRPE